MLLNFTLKSNISQFPKLFLKQFVKDWEYMKNVVMYSTVATKFCEIYPAKVLLLRCLSLSLQDDIFCTFNILDSLNMVAQMVQNSIFKLREIFIFRYFFIFSEIFRFSQIFTFRDFFILEKFLYSVKFLYSETFLYSVKFLYSGTFLYSETFLYSVKSCMQGSFFKK